MFDLILRGGTIVDGTGAPRFSGDVAITGGVIREVGRVSGPAHRVIDATGCLVAPGWVDIHTHFDGQATWDPLLTPSSWHGVTTALMGNCGVGFAPAAPHQREWMIELMEGVEDIPGAVLVEGMRWEWESFPEYLDALERQPRAIDIGAQLAHGPLRVYVMGERGARREAATDDDLAKMRAVTRAAIDAGAFGFSSSRTIVHRTARGDSVPSLGAAARELQMIAMGLRDATAGVLQLISDFEDLDAEFALMREAARASGRPLSFSLLQNDFSPDGWRDLLARTTAARAEGLDIRAQVACRPIGLVEGLECSLNPFFLRPSYQAIADQPLAERVRIMRDPVFRAKLLAEREPSALRNRERNITQSFHKLFPLGAGGAADYEPAPEASVAGIAAREGRTPQEVAYDLLLEDEGRKKFNFPLYNYSALDLEAVREMMQHPHTLLGLGDAGAHCGYICDASYPTYLLTHWARDRTRGRLLPLEWLVHAQTARNAQAIGLNDRGVIAPGRKADLNVIDFERLRLPVPEMVYDLPAGGRRLVQKAEGYRVTIVAGETILEGGEPTGARPGRLVRA